MSDPVVTAKHVLETKKVSGIPMLALKAIADSENIRYCFNEYSDTWDGTLLFKGQKRAILINTRISSAERHNFTFAHELGHHFLKHPPTYHSNSESSIQCSTGNFESESKPREVQANQFAVELLMPEAQFRPGMAGAPVDFTLIGSLARQFMVSKQACSYRITALTSSPCIIIRSKDGHVTGVTASRSARGHLQQLESIPIDTAAHIAIQQKWGHNDFEECDANKWLARTVPGNKLVECTHCHKDSGYAMTILKW